MNSVFKSMFIVFSFLWICKEILMPSGAAALWSNDFMRLVNECDQAMEANWYYMQNTNVDSKSDIIQTLVCHDYDKIRKQLLISGLPESYLSWLGLKSLEIYQRSPEEFVEQHGFSYK